MVQLKAHNCKLLGVPLWEYVAIQPGPSSNLARLQISSLQKNLGYLQFQIASFPPHPTTTNTTNTTIIINNNNNNHNNHNNHNDNNHNNKEQEVSKVFLADPSSEDWSKGKAKSKSLHIQKALATNGSEGHMQSFCYVPFVGSLFICKVTPKVR